MVRSERGYVISTVVSFVSWAQPSDLSFGKITTACVTEYRGSAGRKGTVEAYFYNLDLGMAVSFHLSKSQLN